MKGKTCLHINTCFNLISSEGYIFPYISLKLFVCWLTWLVTEQHTYEWSLTKTSVHPFVGYHLLNPWISPYIIYPLAITFTYFWTLWLPLLHLFSPLWWQRCSFNLQACRITKQARSTCVVANLLGMQSTENLVWANDLLKGDQDTANMISSMFHQKNINEKARDPETLIKWSGQNSRSLN